MNDQKKDSQYKNACLWLTLGWLILFNIICWLGIFEIPKSLNEIGDFFAGLFSPIAFLWLIYGYFQNSASLQAQIKEMKESVDQQKKAVEIQTQNLQVIKQQLMPKLHVNDGRAQLIDHNGQSYDSVQLYLSLANLGNGDIYNLRITHEVNSTLLVKFSKIKIDEHNPIEFKLNTNVVGELPKVLIQIDYEDLLGQYYTEKYSLNCTVLDSNLPRDLMVTVQKVKL